jgi:Tol biopolymer transport system component
MMDTSGHGTTRVTTRAMGFYALASPSFAPEGERLTFEGTLTRGATPQIYVVNVNGSELVQLTTSGGTEPQWSPDETFVAYTEIRHESTDRIDPDTARALSPLVAAPPSEEGEKINRVILPNRTNSRPYTRSSPSFASTAPSSGDR